MDLLKYSYRLESSLCPPVEYHSFKLRAIPMECSFQHRLECSIDITPPCVLSHAVDAFGNDVQWGNLTEAHTLFSIESRGTVETGDYLVEDKCPADYYLFPTALTGWNEDIRKMFQGAGPAEIMHRVHSLLTYERFMTDNSTTAIDVFLSRKGVCQDYAHLMIAACRSVGLRARYVNGLTLGEGETHAWVEVHDGEGLWRGYDPTLDTEIRKGYLKFAHGRDVSDCPSNRGRFYGWTTERMIVNCKLETS